MGRLFWKFFLFTIVAQFIATVGIGGALWLKHVSNDAVQQKIFDQSPPAEFMLHSAASTLQFGGVAALSSLLKNSDAHHPIFVIDEQNQELLARPVTPELVQQARKLSCTASRDCEVPQVMGADGKFYILFMPRGAAAPAEPHAESGPPPDHDQFLPFLPIISAISVGLIFAAFLAWYFSKPINSLRDAFDAVSNGNLDVNAGRSMGRRRDELSDLGRNFDGMVKHLRILLEGQQQLLHDVSHELRSPLARLQMAIGLARQQPAKINSSLERIEREIVRMDKLVGGLLTLSRMETKASGALQNNVNPDALIRDLITDARFEAEAKQQTIELRGNFAVHIQGDAGLLSRAIENVMRNALKFSPAGSSIVLQSASDTEYWHLSILDQGPGVAPAELQTIFEPFFRSSSADSTATGYGLGLAIAQRILTAHGGSISATNRDVGGLSVELELPLSSTSQ